MFTNLVIHSITYSRMTESTRRLEIARMLAEKAFTQGGFREMKSSENNESQEHMRYRRTLELISNPTNKELYSMDMERGYITNSKILNIVSSLKKLSSEKSTTRILVRTLRRILCESLYGCEVYVGICSDASVSVIEFNDEKDYVRRLVRGQSTCFECLDQKDLVLQASPIADSNAKSAVRDKLPSGESVVYIPLLGKGVGIGVVEIHGLQTEGITYSKNFERNINSIRTMIRVRDYKFIKSLRLWRLPTQKSGGQTNPFDEKNYNIGHYQVVCGHITEVIHEENGVPFFGGARYNVSWEDGLKERLLTATELLEVAKNTPQSLGCTSTLDLQLAEDLLKLGFQVGEILEGQRRFDALRDLQKKLFVPNLNDEFVCKRVLEAVLAIAYGVREVTLYGEDPDGKIKSIVSNAPLMRPKGSGSAVDLKRALKAVKAEDKRNTAVLLADEDIEWICFKLDITANFRYQTQDRYVDLYLFIIRIKHPNQQAGVLDIRTFEQLSDILSKCLNENWKRFVRKKFRNQLLKDIERRSKSWEMAPDSDLCRLCLECLLPGFPGAHVYIALLEREHTTNLPNILHYYAASAESGSQMSGKKLLRGQGLSFDVLEDLKALVIRHDDDDKRKFLERGSAVEVLYGRKKWKAKILRDRGHGSYDIRFDSGETEAGVSLDRITPIHTSYQLHLFGHIEYPFVCVPVRHRDKGMGIIGVDTLTSIEIAFYEKHPETNLISVLEHAGRLLGTFIDTQKKKIALNRLTIAIRNFNIRREDIAEELMKALQENLLYVNCFVAARVLYEQNTDKKQKGLDIYYQQGKLSDDHYGWLLSFDALRSSKKSIQRKGEKVIWMLFRNRAEERGGEGKIFIYMLVQNIPFKEVDLEFLDAMYKVLSGALQNLDSRKQRAHLRIETLQDIKDVCNKWSSMSKQEWFDEVCALIHECYYEADLYIGMLGPSCKDISFTLATTSSEMVGQRLIRGRVKGVSFHVVDSLTHVCIANQSAPFARDLYHFGDPKRFSFPFLSIPLVAHLDSAMGVLNVDNCNEMGSGTERVEDLQNYFVTAASYVSSAIRKYKIAEAKIEIKGIIKKATDFLHGIRLIKGVIHELIPNAIRVAEVRYEPYEVVSLTGRIEDRATTDEDFVVFIRLVSTACLCSTLQSPFVTLSWQGNSLFSTYCGDSVEDSGNKILIPKGTPITRVMLSLEMKGTVNKVEKDVAMKPLTLHYLANVPCSPVEHTLDSPSLPEVHVGKVKLISKMYLQHSVLCFSIQNITCRNLSYGGNTDPPDPFCIVKWSDSEIFRTEAMRGSDHPSWRNLKVDLRLLEENYRKETKMRKHLIIEVWDSNILGKSSFLGCFNMSDENLHHYFDHPGTWIALQALNALPYKQEQYIQGEIMLEGLFLKAKDYDEIRIHNDLKVDYNLLDSNNSSKEDGGDNNHEGVRKYYQVCELGIICARNLCKSIKTNRSNSFCIIKFNNDEIGRTTVISDNTNPKWTDESFDVRIPRDEDLSLSTLSVEVWTLDDTAKGEFQGIVEISGKTLSSLLCGDKYRRQWFDLEKSMSIPQSEQRLVQGEIKLSGRPQSVEITGDEEDARDRELLEVNIVAGSNLYPNTTNKSSEYLETYCILYWNDRLVHQTKAVTSLDAPVWKNERVAIRLPNSKGLSQCCLRVDVFAIISESNDVVKTGEVRVEDEILVKLLGNLGKYTMWIPLQEDKEDEVEAQPGDEVEDRSTKTVRELRLSGGPVGAHEILVEDGKELYIDILAGYGLIGATKTSDVNPYCVIYWNKREIARTNTILRAFDPVWKCQRFIVRMPFIAGLDIEKTILKCELKIDVWDEIKETKQVIKSLFSRNVDTKTVITSRFLGCVYFKSYELQAFFREQFSTMAWYKLTYDPRSKNQNQGVISGELKLRGGFVGIPDDPSVTMVEYKLDVISASGLGVADAFDGSEPTVIITWNSQELRRTRSVGISTEPIWQDESFLLRIPNGSSMLQQQLTIEVVDKRHHDFLGCVMMSDQVLYSYLRRNNNEIQSLSLMKSPHLDDDLNELVQGKITFRIGKVHQPLATDFVSRYQDAILWIRSATGLSSVDNLGKSDPFCSVLWSSELECGREDLEIAKTKVIKGNINPVWNNEKSVVKIPIFEDDWSKLTLRIEVWDMETLGRGPFLGCVILKGLEVKQLLARTGDDCFRLSSYRLETNPTATDLDQSLVKGMITVCGGLKSTFDERESEELNNADTEMALLSLEADATNPQAIDEALNTTSAIGKFGSKGNIKVVNIVNVDKKPISCYVVLSWNRRRIGRTRTVHKSNNPRFNEEIFEVKLPLDDNPADCKLQLEIYSTSLDGIDTMVGSLTVTGKKLQDLFLRELDGKDFQVEHTSKRKDCKINLCAYIIKTEANNNGNDHSALGKVTSGEFDLQKNESFKRLPGPLLHQIKSKRFRLSKLYTADVTTLKPLMLQIQIFEIAKLTKTDIFNSINPYVTIIWQNKVIGKTAVLQNKANGSWVEEIFKLEKPGNAILNDCVLILEVFNKKIFGSDVFLGCVYVSGEDLIACCTNTEPVWYDLRSSDKYQNNRLLNVTGKLEFGIKVLKEMTSAPAVPLPTGFKEMELSILAAQGLAKVDSFGKTDAYCIISWNDTIIGKTSTIKGTMDPIWDDQNYILRVPDSKKAFLDSLNVDKDKGCPLSIEVWHGSQIALTKAIFLGCIKLSNEHLAELLYDSERLKRECFPLIKSKYLAVKEQKLVQGKLEVLIGPKYDPQSEIKGVEVEFYIDSVTDLRRLNSYGKCNPCCLIRWNHRYIGRTSIQSSTSDSLWNHELFQMKIPHSQLIEDCSLYIEVWDWEEEGRNQFFGCLSLSGKALKKLVIEECMVSTAFPLKKSDYLSPNLQDFEVYGKLEIRGGVVGAPPKIAIAGQFELTIFGAENLAKNDCYCSVKLNGKEVGRTAIIHKFVNPVWTGEKFIISLPAYEAIFLLELDVWNRNTAVVGDDFLGCITIDEMMIRSILFQQEFQQTLPHESKELRLWLPLEKSSAIPIEKQLFVQGKLQVGAKPFSEKQNRVNLIGSSTFKLAWNEARDIGAGQPFVELSIISGKNFIPSPQENEQKEESIESTNPNDVQATYNGVVCQVLWDNNSVGMTDIANDLINPKWTESSWTLRIPLNADSHQNILQLEVWGIHNDISKKVKFIGRIVLSFMSLLRLFHGEITLHLDQRNASDYVKGSITFRMKFTFPFWDSTRLLTNNKVMRRIHVLCAHDLTKVNDDSPHVKCLINVDGAIKKKSVLLHGTMEPSWSDVVCDLVIDLFNPPVIFIQVIHVDMIDKKEICIGEAEIPAELIMRPPERSWDAWLVPHPKKVSNKYRFNVRGYVSMNLSEIQGEQNVLPWSTQYTYPVAALTLRDASREWMDESKIDEELIMLQQRLWLGTAIDLAGVHEVANRPQWIVMPVRDFGIRVSGKNIGTRPGYRFAFCLERPWNRAVMSDVTMLRDVYEDIERCMIDLRLNEVYDQIRAHALDALRVYMTTVTHKASNSSLQNAFMDRIINTILSCIPGCSVYIGTLSADSQVLFYKRLDSSSGITDDSKTIHYHLDRTEEWDWESIGRISKPTIIKKFSDMGSRKITCNKPFRNTRFPRIIVPLNTGDVSMGVLGVENFDIFRRGSNNDWHQEGVISKWLSDLASMGGEVLYSGRELKSLSRLEDYINRWYCSANGLMTMLLELCVDVLQGCRLLEVWLCSKSNHRIKNIIYKVPEVKVAHGRRLILSKIDVFGSFFDDLEEVPAGYVLGIKYLGIEQCHAIKVKGGDHDHLTINQETVLSISKTEREIFITLYIIKDDFTILKEYSGVTRSVTLKETSLECFLSPTSSLNSDEGVPSKVEPLNASSVTTPVKEESIVETQMNLMMCRAVISVVWPPHDEGRSTSYMNSIRDFSVTIRRAYGLKKADNFGVTNDPYFIVKWGNEQIGRSKVRKATLNPVWEETFSLPFNGIPQSCFIELWHVTLLGDSIFLGEVELSDEVLLFPPPDDVEYPLAMKPELDKRKQRAVGGHLVISHKIQFYREVTPHKQPSKSNVTDIPLFPNGKISEELLEMETIALNLTLSHASDLTKTNILSANSPFAMIYIGLNDEPIFTSEVVNNSQNPQWDTEYKINLGIIPSEDLKVSDFPKIRIEIWDKTRNGTGEFLGQVEVDAPTYLSKPSADFLLQPSKTQIQKRKLLGNATIKGTLSLKFEVVEGSDMSTKNYYIFSWNQTLQPLPHISFIFLFGRDLTPSDKAITCNPYCIVLYENIIIGQTTSRPKTANPKWQDEVIVWNAGFGRFIYSDILIEVRSRVPGAEGILLGKIYLKPDVFLHPSQLSYTEPLEGANIAPLPKKGNKKANLPGQPTLTFKIAVSRKPQHIRAHRNTNRILDEVPLSLEEEPVDLTVLRDLQAEQDRMNEEGLQFPKLIESLKQQVTEYEAHTFDRTQVISELHYGQFVAACDRRERTVLRSKQSDIVCLPSGLRVANSESKDTEYVSLVAKYGSGKYSRRDIEFLDKIKEITARGLYKIDSRDQRKRSRQTIITDLHTLLHPSSLKMSTQPSYIENLVESKYLAMIEEAFNCAAQLFILDVDGHTLRPKSQRTRRSNILAPNLVKIAAKLCRHRLLLQIHQGTFSVADVSWETISQVCMPSLEELREQIRDVEGDSLCEEIYRLAPQEASMGMCFVPVLGHFEGLFGILVISGTDSAYSSTYKTSKMPDAWSRLKQRRRSSFNNRLDTSANSPITKETTDVKRPEEGYVEDLISIAKVLGNSIFESRSHYVLDNLRSYLMNITCETQIPDICRYTFGLVVLAFPWLCEISIWCVDMDQKVTVPSKSDASKGTEGPGQEKPSDGTNLSTAARKEMFSSQKQSSSFLDSIFQSNTNATTGPRPVSKTPFLASNLLERSIRLPNKIENAETPMSAREKDVSRKGLILCGYFGSSEEVSRKMWETAASDGSSAHSMVGEASHDNESPINIRQSRRRLNNQQFSRVPFTEKISKQESKLEEVVIVENNEEVDRMDVRTSMESKDLKLEGEWVISEPLLIRKQRAEELEKDLETHPKLATMTSSMIPENKKPALQSMSSTIMKSVTNFSNLGISSTVSKTSNSKTSLKNSGSKNNELKIGKSFEEANDMIHAEIFRCVNTLHLNEFFISSGHLLCTIARDGRNKSQLDSLFKTKEEEEEDIVRVTSGQNDTLQNTKEAKPMGHKNMERSIRSSAPPKPQAPLPAGPLPTSSAILPTSKPYPTLKPPAPAKTNENITSPSQQPPPVKKTSNKSYFLVVDGSGIGGQHGWGVLGEAMEKFLGDVSLVLDDCLGKLTQVVDQSQSDKSALETAMEGGNMKDENTTSSKKETTAISVPKEGTKNAKKRRK